MLNLRLYICMHKLSKCRYARGKRLDFIINSMDTINTDILIRHKYANLLMNYFITDLHNMADDLEKHPSIHNELKVHLAASKMYRLMVYIKDSHKVDQYSTLDLKQMGRDLSYVQNVIMASLYPFDLSIFKARKIYTVFVEAMGNKMSEAILRHYSEY